MTEEISVDEVTGVGPSTAVKLFKANIRTASQLSQCSYQQLIPLGIPKGTAEKLIKNARLMTPAAAAVQIPVATVIVDQSATTQPQQTPAGYTEEDISNASLCGLELADYLAMSPSGRAREVRIAMMQKNVEPEEEDFASDLNLGDLTARDFLAKQRKREQELRRVRKIEQSEAVTVFAEREVHGHDLKDEPINVHGQRLNKQDEKEPEGSKIDDIVIRRPKRKKTGRRSSEMVQQIVDNILD